MLVQSKSLLAKLLAAENITVEHRKTQTAYFDPKNRVMVLPIWKEMTPDVYDLLLGHETGHALFTPSEGWHNAIISSQSRAFKTFLNVIEDVRIEKKVQEKFPGLKACFTRGYNDFMKRDFFGIENIASQLDILPFIDRINLHYKVGSYLNIKFSDKEQVYLKRLDNLKKWEDVEKLARELFAMAKDDLRQQLMDQFANYEEGEDDPDEQEFDYDGEFEEDADEFGTKRKARSFFGGSNRIAEDEPYSRTDDYFRRKETELLADDVKPYYYANLPLANLKQIIVPYKNMKLHYNDFAYYDPSLGMKKDVSEDPKLLGYVESAKNKYYKEFTDTNKKYISYLVKEFELRRNARQFARASIAKTGALDVKKIYSYKINDDLFKRISVVPNGKSHGLVMFIDYSGSMTENIDATIEQTIVLATFCKKVNIPFRVYAFTDDFLSPEDLMSELSITDAEGYHRYFESNHNGRKSVYNKFSSENGELDLNGSKAFRLREYLSSEMSGTEFREGVKFWLLAGKLHNARSWSRRTDTMNINEPMTCIRNTRFESLNGTPLNEAIVASVEIVKQFRKQYRLDVVNTVFLTDGDANENNSIYSETASSGSEYFQRYNSTDRNLVIRNLRDGTQAVAPPRTALTQGLLSLLKETTGSNVIGFFITGGYSIKGTIRGKMAKHGLDSTLDIDNIMKSFRKNKFVMLNDVGYDDFYIIPGGKDLVIEEDKLEVEGTSKNDFKKAFMKMQKGKVTNRVLLSRFVEKIA
jgi:hypothetical protein